MANFKWMTTNHINFDVNATEKPSKAVLKALQELYKKGCSNPNASYISARDAAYLIDKARNKVAEALGCYSNEIFFTSGASESNSWVAHNYKLHIDKRSHHSLKFDMKDINPIYDEEIIAFPLMVSETGQCLYREYDLNDGNQYFMDLTQAIGRININLHEMPNVAFASGSAHKFGGILGAGFLYIREDMQRKMKPLIYGSQENWLRGGTQNVPAIMCLGEAIEEAYKNIKINEDKIINIISTILYGIIDINDEIARNKCKEGYIKAKANNNVLNITFRRMSAATAVQIFDNNGINISAGSACDSTDEKPSDSYLASGYTEDEAMRTIRISVGCNNTIREAKKFVKIFKEIIDNYDK